MINKSNKINLKNKFKNIQSIIGDIETTEDVLNDLPSQASIKGKRNKFLTYIDYFIRSSRIVLNITSKVVRFIVKDFLTPIYSEFKNIISIIFTKINDFQEKSEIKVDEKLIKIESEIHLAKLNSISLLEKINLGVSQFENEIAALFVETNGAVTLDCSTTVFSQVQAGLEFDLSLFELVTSKIIENKMIKNIKNYNIVTSVDDKRINCRLEFDLKASSERWAKLFSMHVSSEILRRIENYQGNIENVHLINNSQYSEKFIVIFSHQRLDIFTEVAREEKLLTLVDRNKKNTRISFEL